MKNMQRQVALGIGLVALSAVLFVFQIRIFHAERDTFFYLLQDLAFIPIQVLLVTVIVDQVLRAREKSAMLNKLNMVIGTFFSDCGSRLLKLMADFDHETNAIRPELLVTGDWDDKRFESAAAVLRGFSFRIDVQRGDLAGLKQFLATKRGLLLRLLENQNLLEHETFTELLWAISHLTEELEARPGLSRLSAADQEHLAVDITRAYVILIAEWLTYMKHLKKEYPYLFSLGVRLNPFDEHASASFE